MNKGFTLQDSHEQMERLNKAGIKFYYGFMYGAAGSGKGIENAIANAKIINTVKPYGIVPTTLGAFGDSPLAKEVEAGNFTPVSEREVLKEQKKLIELLDIETKYMGIHALNTVAFDAQFPEDKEGAIYRVSEAIDRLDDNYLNSIPLRQSV